MIMAWHVMVAAGAALYILLCACGYRGRSIIVMILTLGVVAMQLLALTPVQDDIHGLFLWTGIAVVLYRYSTAVAALCLASAICYPLENAANYLFPATHPSAAIQVVSNALWVVALATAGGAYGLVARVVGRWRSHHAPADSMVASRREDRPEAWRVSRPDHSHDHGNHAEG